MHISVIIDMYCRYGNVRKILITNIMMGLSLPVKKNGMAIALAILGFLQWVVIKLMIKYLIILNLLSILKCYMHIENANENQAKQEYFKIKS